LSAGLAPPWRPLRSLGFPAAAVTVINVLLGWTAAGWLVALILAVRRAAPGIQVIGQVNGQLPVTPRDSQKPWQGG
jgi:hypothetical protein